MSRNYPNFLDAYMEYHRDQFVPDKFHYWTGISVIGGAIERKAYLPWSKHLNFYPNLYILLVAKPAIGKSSVINPGVGMLKEVSNRMDSSGVKFIPSQVTEAKLIELMRHATTYNDGSNIVKQCAGYYFASEASACLKDLYGGFIATITSFYDCDAHWEKATVGMGDETYNLVNICFNLIAGCTFDYLGKLITDDNIMGGFASRLTYVIQNEVVKRDSPFQNRGISSGNKIEREKLVQDLVAINSLTGQFTANEEFKARWEAWFPRFDAERQALPSEKLQALMARKSTTALKLCMILSASESNDLVLKAHHWDRAMELTNEVEKDLPGMLREGKSKDVHTQDGLNQAIFKLLLQFGGAMPVTQLEQALQLTGFQQHEVRKTIETYKSENSVFAVAASHNGGVAIRLIGNPDHYL